MSDARDGSVEASDSPVAAPHESDALASAHDPDMEFRPIEIQGEPLSETIIRERR